MRWVWSLISGLGIVVTLAARAEPASDSPLQEPATSILAARCFSCHGPEEQRGGLRTDSLKALLTGGHSGPALIPGDAASSLLVQSVLHTVKGLEMPPRDKLSETEIAVLERWANEGAPWPEPVPVSEAALASTLEARVGDAWTDPRNPIVRIFGGQRLDLWSFQPVQSVELPAAAAAATPSNPLDRFLMASSGNDRARAGAAVDRRALLRRLSFNLTGLPPTAEEVAAFVSDTSPDAHERWVERLLASPRYGEHQARWWLDVVRYSDSNGFDWDEFRPQAWRFRDYVIRSFNADKPFDQFILEQLAGDELVEGPPQDRQDQDRLIATGYLRIGPQDNSAPLFNEQARARAEFMADLVETTGSAFLGLTLSCCRCHDHKTDPLSQADWFRMRAFFEPVKYANDLPLDLAGDQAEIRRHNDALEAQLAPLRAARAKLLADVKDPIRADRMAQLSAEDRDLLNTAADQVAEESKARFEELRKQVEPSDADATKAFSAEQKEEADLLVKAIQALQAQERPFALGLLATDTTEAVPVTRVLYQGDHRAERERVEAGFPSLLDPNPAVLLRPVNRHTSGRRLTLARWIASPDNPLTARVLVNRVWQEHFGEGLVATPNDFGFTGARPNHPRLLDWLATEFVRNGWSIKALHRLIVTSDGYRRAAAADTGAAWATPQLRRLSAEQLRDAMLTAAGLLRDYAAGPPIWPELPVEILQANPAFLDDNAEKTKGWYPSPAAERSVRSIFLVQKRTVRIPFLEAFDLPDNSTSCPRRTLSTVAPQALSLLNSSLATESAIAFAERVQRDSGPAISDQVRRAFLLALQRAPDPEEQRGSEQFLRERSLPEFCRVLLNLNEFAYLD
jgi:hypothetical protein